MFDDLYHVFCFLTGGVWHRSARILEDRVFDELMDMLDWKLPYNMRAFHFTSKTQSPVTRNPVFLSRPVIDVDLDELFSERIGVRLIRPDENPLCVHHLGCGFIIVETEDTYGRLLDYPEADGEMLFEELYPIPFARAKEFVEKHHRHNEAPQSHKFSIGLLESGKLIGVIIASMPKAKALDDGYTLELNRNCVLPDQRNACSKLYAKAIQAGKSMGFRRFVTYTLPHESGSSLKAVGFKWDGLTRASPHGWDHPSRRRPIPTRYPTGPKNRWVLYA